MNKLEQIRRFARQRFIVPPQALMTKRLVPAMYFVNSVVIDRTRTLVDQAVPNMSIVQEIPTAAVNPGSFAHVSDLTAAEVIAAAGENEITVLYSGGLDSTAVVCALLKAGARINVLGSKQSVTENPVFFHEVLASHPLVTLKIDNPLQFVADHADGHFYVTGECGAHIMGTTNWCRFIGTDVSPDERNSFLMNPEPFYGLPDDVAAMLRQTLDRCPVHLRTNYDAQWWAIFALKWQFVQFRIQMWAGAIRNFHNFFMTDAWQHWALTTTAEEKCPEFRGRYYKMPMREYIFDFCGKREASLDMPKRFSMELTYPELIGMEKTFVLADPPTVGFLTDATRFRNQVQREVLQ